MQCNLCKSDNLEEVINVPDLPISKDYSGSPFRFDLKLHYCHNCGLLQICEPILPSLLYGNQFYRTGFHRPKHLDDLIACALHYKDPARLIEVGCNDGQCLREFRSYGFTALDGIEPNKHAADLATGIGIIYYDYLSSDSASDIVKSGGSYDFVLCRHVIEHVTNIYDFFMGLRTLVSDDGILIAEFPNVEMGFDSTSPCILFEEHVNHFTESCLYEMFRHFGFHILEKRYYTFGGGSIALVCRKTDMIPFLPSEAKTKQSSYYKSYNDRLNILREKTHRFLDSRKNKDICLYGAASRSAMFVNVMKIADRIDYVFDDRKSLSGAIMPGTDKKITSIKNTPNESLGLLGVGSDNEWKVKRYFSETLSLLPPRFENFQF